MYLVYITCKDLTEAKKIAKELLTRDLIKCANIVDSNSLYIWKGKLKDEKEKILVGKSNKKFQDIQGVVKGMHSYDLPCILKIAVDANKAFEKWVSG